LSAAWARDFFKGISLVQSDVVTKLVNCNQQRKEAKYIMTITKIAAVVALAAATLTLGACAQKQAPAPASVGKSK
jgi:hypothetical protein